MAKTIYTFPYNDDLNGARVVYMDNNIINVLGIAQALGWKVEVVK